MVEESAVNISTLGHNNLDGNDPQKIREALAESRASLGYRISALEEEVERRILETFDHVSRRIINASEQISGLTKPIQEVQERVHSAQENIKTSPYKSLSISMVGGIFFGALLGVRHKNKKYLSERAPLDPPSRYRTSDHNRSSPWRDIALTLAMHGVEQLIQAGVTEIGRRRVENRVE